MQFIDDFRSLELIFRFALPILIFAGLIVGYIRAREFFNQCEVDKRIIALLTLGAITTSFINIPLFVGKNSLYAINFGGVIIPLVIAAYFFYKLRLNPVITIISVLIISLVAHQLSYIDARSGIYIDFPWYFIPIFISVLIALIIHYKQPKLVVMYAYSIATFGMLIGVDIAHVPSIIQYELSIGYFGGLGVFDLVFFSGLFAIALSLVLVYPRLVMKKVELTRTTKVKLDLLVVAPLKKRVSAFFIDLGVQALIIGIIIFILLIFHTSLNVNTLLTGILGFSLFWWAVFIHIFYFLVFETISGQTPGKRLLKIKVVRLNDYSLKSNRGNRKLDFLSAFTRNIFRITDLILCIISVYYLIFNLYHQRPGDMFAESVVTDVIENGG